MEELVAKYATVGFSYAICVYLLWERRMEHASFRLILGELVTVVKGLDQLIRDRVK